MRLNENKIAQEILEFLKNSKDSASLVEITYFLEHPLHDIELGVKKLVSDGLAVLDVEDETVKLVMMPNFDNNIVNENCMKSNEMVFA